MAVSIKGVQDYGVFVVLLVAVWVHRQVAAACVPKHRQGVCVVTTQASASAGRACISVQPPTTTV